MDGGWQLTAQRVLCISLGAVLGANARYWLGLAMLRRFGAQFPWGTLTINVTGSLALGMVYGALLKREGVPAELLRLLVGVGFLGAYTTFSTFSVEVLALLQAHAWGRALAYVGSSVLLGLGGAALGMWLGEQGPK